MLQTRIPILAVVVALVGTAASASDHAASPAFYDERAFAEYLRNIHGVNIAAGANGRLVVRPAWQVVMRPEELVCARDDPRVLREIEYAVARECAKRDDPPLDENAWVEEAAAETEAWLIDRAGSDAFPEEDVERLRLQEAGDRRVRRILRDRGLVERLVASWTTHVRGRSTCYEDLMGELAIMRERLVQDGEVCEGHWKDIIEVCTSWDDDVRAHIAFHPTAATSTAKRTALRALAEAGIGACLAAIIEASGDESFVAAVRSLSAATSVADTEAIRRRAWEVWKQAGVERWLQLTEKTGRVPEDVAAALDRCAD